VAPGACPPGLRRFLLVTAAFAAAFLLTGPWRIAGREIGRTPALFATVAVLGLAALAVRPGWRSWARELLSADVRLSRRALAIFCVAIAAALARVLLARFAALEVNAWDFSLYFDRPVESVLHGRLLYSDLLKGSILGDDASFAMFAFVPLYAIAATPMWLVLAPALAIAGAAGAAFLLFRDGLADDAAALLLSAAFVLHSATARAVQYVFHVEIFYPLAIFLSLWALRRKRPVLFAAGILLLVALKEDALLPATALALVALLMRADRRWIAASWLAAAAVFCADYFLILPRFSASGGGGKPWFSWYWARYGPTPLAAVAGIAGHPLRAAADVARSGLGNLLEPLLLTPLAGLEWLAAALPALIPYAVAGHEKLSRFALYYSMPVLPFLFIAAGWGLARIARRFPDHRIALRIGSALVLAACALDGAGYTLSRPRPERREIEPLLAGLSPATPAWVQGALLPHAGYAARFSALDRDGAVPDGAHAYLLDPDADPYPFPRSGLRALARTLDADTRYARRTATPGLVLYAPSSPPAR
jgi:uncharacterized membrane protein